MDFSEFHNSTDTVRMTLADGATQSGKISQPLSKAWGIKREVKIDWTSKSITFPLSTLPLHTAYEGRGEHSRQGPRVVVGRKAAILKSTIWSV